MSGQACSSRKNLAWTRGIIGYFELLGVWDFFYENSAIDEGISTHYVNLPYLGFLESEPELSLEPQHESVLWFDVEPIIQETGNQVYMREYASWIDKNRYAGIAA